MTGLWWQQHDIPEPKPPKIYFNSSSIPFSWACYITSVITDSGGWGRKIKASLDDTKTHLPFSLSQMLLFLSSQNNSNPPPLGTTVRQADAGLLSSDCLPGFSEWNVSPLIMQCSTRREAMTGILFWDCQYSKYQIISNNTDFYHFHKCICPCLFPHSQWAFNEHLLCGWNTKWNIQTKGNYKQMLNSNEIDLTLIKSLPLSIY